MKLVSVVIACRHRHTKPFAFQSKLYRSVHYYLLCAQVVAFNDVNAKAPVHVLVIPRKPIPSLADAQPQDEQVD